MDSTVDLSKFRCLRCGACCCWPGDVRLSAQEEDDIAAYLGLDLIDFLDRYTRLTLDRGCLSLIEAEGGSCFFYDKLSGCRINDVKPRQCREFPFNWRCPGWEEQCAGARALKEHGS